MNSRKERNKRVLAEKHDINGFSEKFVRKIIKAEKGGNTIPMDDVKAFYDQYR